MIRSIRPYLLFMLVAVLLSAVATFVQPHAVEAQPLAQQQTITCDDGSPEGINGYTPGSECANYMQQYTCTHSDAPSGPIDTLTCENAPPPPQPTPQPPTPEPTPPPPEYDLELTITASANPIQEGDQVSIIYTLRNLGPQSAPIAAALIDQKEGFTTQQVIVSQGTHSAFSDRHRLWEAGVLPSGASATYEAQLLAEPNPSKLGEAWETHFGGVIVVSDSNAMNTLALYRLTVEPKMWDCDGQIYTQDEMDQAFSNAEATGFYTSEQMNGFSEDPCRLFVVTIEAIADGTSSGDTKGELQCPPDGNQAPSIRWVARGFYGEEYAYYQLSQYACWNGEIVTDVTGDEKPPEPVITTDVTPLGQLAGISFTNAGSTSSQYEQWNGNAKGAYRVIQTDIVFTVNLLFGIGEMVGLSNLELRPTLSIVIRANGTVERGCSGGETTGGSCPRNLKKNADVNGY